MLTHQVFSRQAVLDTFRFRHACKEFDSTHIINNDDFDVILEAGRLSPSSFGYEPWRFLVIQDPAIRGQLLPVVWGAQKQLPTASHFVAILARKNSMRYDGEYVRHMMHDILKFSPERIKARSKVYRTFQESDFHLLDSERALFDWNCRQAYIALANMMTAAAMMAIDSCPIEGFVQNTTDAVLQQNGLMDVREWGLAVLVAFGYRVSAQPAKIRQPLADICQWV